MTDVIRKRARGSPGARVAWWDVLAVFPIAAAFVAAGQVVPDTRSRPLNALIWAAFGTAVAVVAFLADRSIRRGRPHARWWAMNPLVLAIWFTVFAVVNQLLPDQAGLAGAVAYVVVAVTGQALANRSQRREVARRREEIDELVRKF